jgi:hypothetical protein
MIPTIVNDVRIDHLLNISMLPIPIVREGCRR